MRPAVVSTGRPISSSRLSINSGLSFHLKFFRARVIFPFSIRNVPSRVSPVCSTVRASSVRM
jgi:hypothetical protein